MESLVILQAFHEKLIARHRTAMQRNSRSLVLPFSGLNQT